MENYYHQKNNCDYVCKKAVTTVNDKAVIAWFTEEIPIKAGPSLYYGLPGLILEVQTHHEGNILMKNVTFDTIKEEKLMPPTQGVPIDRKEFDTLQEQLEETKAIQEAEDFFND